MADPTRCMRPREAPNPCLSVNIVMEETGLLLDPPHRTSSISNHCWRKGSLTRIKWWGNVGWSSRFVSEEAQWGRALHRPPTLHTRAMQACKISTCPFEWAVGFFQAPWQNVIGGWRCEQNTKEWETHGIKTKQSLHLLWPRVTRRSLKAPGLILVSQSTDMVWLTTPLVV